MMETIIAIAGAVQLTRCIMSKGCISNRTLFLVICS